MQQNKKLKDFKRLYRLYDDGKVFVAFDTETTSLTPSTGRVIEIGAVKFSKDGILDTWKGLFNPQQKLPPIITEITNLTDKDLEDKPVIQKRLSDFINFIQDSILIGHNVQFDLNFLNFECDNCNLPKTKNKAIDTLQFVRFVYTNLKSYKLSSLNDFFNLNSETFHRAFDDAETCRKLFEKLINDTRKN